MQTESKSPELRRRAVAYHEAGHAVMGHYFGRLLGAARLYVDTGQLRGEVQIYPGDHGEPYILAAGRACALSFGLPQEYRDYAIDYERLAKELSRRAQQGMGYGESPISGAWITKDQYRSIVQLG